MLDTMFEYPKTINEALGLSSAQSRFSYGDDFGFWYEQKYDFANLISEFWGLQLKVKLVAVTEDIEDQAWKGLVSEWDSYSHQKGQMRLDKTLIRNLLESSLGSRSAAMKQFRLKEISPLELSVFENFFIKLESHWKQFWRVADGQASGNYKFLIFSVEFPNQEIGNFAIAVPPTLTCAKTILPKAKADIVDFASRFRVQVPVDLTVGKTKLSVSDLRGIELGDLLVFEDSDLSTIHWQVDKLFSIPIAISLEGAENKKDFFIEDLEMGEMQQQEQQEQRNGGDLLTDIPVELVAQFKSVNMPLQKLMELDAGGVLPLGLLLDSKLVLMAPGDKPIAQGELCVLGNQFALKIDKINFKAAPGQHPKAHLSAEPQVDAARLEASNAAEQNIMDAMQQQEQHAEAENLQQNLNQELEDVGIDPKELEDLEDLY